MIHRTRRPLLILLVSATLTLTVGVPVLAQAAHEPHSVWTAVGAWLAELSSSLGTWARSDGESVPFLDPNGLTESPPPDATSSGVEGGPEAGSDSVPILDPNG